MMLSNPEVKPVESHSHPVNEDTLASDPHPPDSENEIETQPLHTGAEPSAEQKIAIHQLQQLRGLKRTRSESKCLIGMQYENRSEEEIHHLTPKKGRAKIDPRTTQIRYVLDQYKQKSPIIELHHSFDFAAALWEFVYNYFSILAYPILLYREGIAGFRARDMLSVVAFIGFIPWLVCNIAFWTSSHQTKKCFIFPFFVMNLLRTARIAVLGIKYGYYPTQTFEEYRDPHHKITFDYINSLHLLQGWLMAHPLAVARELYYTEQRLGIDLSALRMTFRNTKAFDLKKGQHCSCSRYWTTLDWFIPYVFLNVVSGESVLLNRKMFICCMIVFQLLILYTTIARILPWSTSQMSFADCDTHCWIIICSLPLSLGFAIYISWLWSMCMAFDMTRRWSRMKLCTHLLDPKRETFQGMQMRQSYKAQLFGSVSKVKPKTLRTLDLQTIDVYSSQTLYSWSQFRTVLFDCGKMFFQREEAYTGLMILCTLFVLVFFVYSLVSDGIVVVWGDLFITVILSLFILGPSMWILSCGNGLNYQTTKQQKILSERAVEMLHFQYMAEDKQLTIWVSEMVKAREMCETVIGVLDLHEYDVSLLGIKVDNSVFQLMVYVIGITLYLVAWLVYQNMIRTPQQ